MVKGRGSRVADGGTRLCACIAIICGMAAVLLACGNASSNSTPTVVVSEASTAAPTGVALPGDPSVTVEQAVLACREKNADALRTFVSGDATDADIDALFARGRDVRLVAQHEPEVAGDTATVLVTLEVQRELETETVEQPWELTLGTDGVWRFAGLPRCY